MYVFILLKIFYIHHSLPQEGELLEARNIVLFIFEMAEPGYKGHMIDFSKCLINA